ncbi:hypothetical protein BH09BAC1_BH09BAC1_12650 [soil metagenome]
MKSRKLLVTALVCIIIFGGIITVFSFVSPVQKHKGEPVSTITTPTAEPKGCVFKTVFNEDEPVRELDPGFLHPTPANALKAIDKGLKWLANAQHPDGGWGAGSHAHQDIIDPHAVIADPATTAMVSMAIMRSGNTLMDGKYKAQLKKATEYLLASIEATPDERLNITAATGTQIQGKLGANIDVILTAQYLTNLLDNLEHDADLKKRVVKDLNICLQKIQRAQGANGSINGAGWAGVLQLGLAGNVLEMAQVKGMAVDSVALDKSRQYQKDNYDVSTGAVDSEDGAGVVLYSVSTTTRSSAKESRKAEEVVADAKKNGTLAKSAPVNVANLKQAGMTEEEALKYNTAYEIYNSAKNQAQDKSVMNGFGNNGGEEFISFLQTGESMVIGKDYSWKKWYDDIAATLLSIQNGNGTWNGHHCITSPVFCTATCILVLSINNDIETLVAMGEEK